MASAVPVTRPRAYRHDALFYDGADEFHTSVSAFVKDAVAAGVPVLVVATADKIDRLRAVADDDLVHLADMAHVGGNPARIIPTWRAFVDAHASGAVRGVGEPIYRERTTDELVEAQQMESLLNVAFSDADDFWLRCPYDVSALDEAVIDEARRSHPVVVEGDDDVRSDLYRGRDAARRMLDTPLPEPTTEPTTFVLRPGKLHLLRAFVSREARAAGLGRTRTYDLVVAANEIASNSLLYAGGGADVRVWRDDGVVCEISDAGVMTDPMVGRVLPGAEEHASRGMWIVNQVCDLVQVRSSPQGSVVRLHMRL